MNDLPVRHILMTTDTVGGVWTYCLELARALEPFGIQISLATMGAPLSPAQIGELCTLPHVEVFESSYRLEWMENPWSDVQKSGQWLLELEERLWPDVVHLNGYAHAQLGWQSPCLVVGHSCVLSWFEAVHGAAAPSQWDRYRKEVRSGLKAADLILTPSKWMLEQLRRHYGPFQAQQGVIHNARRPDLFPPGEKGQYIVSVGRLWDEAKNIAAVARVAKSLPWPVLVAGSPMHPEGGTVQLANVRHLGVLGSTDLARTLSRSSIFILSAKYEPFGLSALEAALAGCALVLGDIPSLREVWGEAACFVRPDDEEQLLGTVQELIRDETRRKSLARQARRQALQFSPDRMAKKYMAAYSHLSAMKYALS